VAAFLKVAIVPRLALALAVLMTLVSAPSAGAYGNTAIWQIGASFNFNSPSGGGGGWGWIELDQGGTGDATLTDCGHLTGGPAGAPPPAGAQAMQIDISKWDVVNGTFVIESGTVTYTGQGGQSLGSVPLGSPFYTGILDAPGHYSTADFLGFTAPGVAIQVQVAQIPNRS
jgi:hypothetical protein